MGFKTLAEIAKYQSDDDFANEVYQWPISYFLNQIQKEVKGLSPKRKDFLRRLCFSKGFALPHWLDRDLPHNRPLPKVSINYPKDDYGLSL